MGKSSAYSMKNVASVLDGQKVVGFWDGDDAIVVEQLEDVGAMMVGADGSSIFSQSANEGARITIRVQHTSPTHRLLHTRLAMQRTPGIRVTGFPFSVMDVDSGEGGAADQCFIEKAPNDEKGKNATVREWVIVTGQWKAEVPSA